MSAMSYSSKVKTISSGLSGLSINKENLKANNAHQEKAGLKVVAGPQRVLKVSRWNKTNQKCNPNRNNENENENHLFLSFIIFCSLS